MKVLNVNTKFKCSCSLVPNPISASEVNKMSGNMANVLTNQCKLVGTFSQCRNIPDPAKNGAPGGPCTMAVTNVWMQANGKISVCGNNILTDKSKMACALGGEISPVDVPDSKMSISIAAGVGGAGNNSGFSSDFSVNHGSANTQDSNTGPDGEIQSDKNNRDEDVDSKSSITQQENKSEHTGNSDSDQNGDSNEEKCNSEEMINEYPYALCDYKNCDCREQCEYLKAPYSADSINNDGGILCDNYKKIYPQLYNEYIALEERMNDLSTEGNWGRAAHHIISGKQIFAKHPYLVKLANYYGYDINTAENCIMLPSTQSFGGKVGIDKQANGYVAMDMMKKQWHVGGHSYVLEEETVAEIQRYLVKIASCNVFFYKDYVEAVEHEINILESKYKKISCRKKDYDAKKEKFIRNINAVSYKVGARLHAFEGGYKRSYPYYVSKESCKFAFDVPPRKKFIVLYQKEKYKRLYNLAVKCVVTRYKKDDYVVNMSIDDEYIITDSKAFVKFSENVRYFINLNDDYEIPWQIDSSRECVYRDALIQASVSDYCESNRQKIISFVEGRENGEYTYVSPYMMVIQRLESLK